MDRGDNHRVKKRNTLSGLAGSARTNRICSAIGVSSARQEFPSSIEEKRMVPDVAHRVPLGLWVRLRIGVRTTVEDGNLSRVQVMPLSSER